MSDASKADTIAYRTQRTISERMQEDPTFYERFSKLLEDAIKAFRDKRLADREYLSTVSKIAENISHRTGDDLPEILKNEDGAQAFFGIAREVLTPHLDAGVLPEVAAQAALDVDKIIRERLIVNWVHNDDVENPMRQAIEDLLYDIKADHTIELTFEEMDAIIERSLDVARARYAR